jgi:hypothetical protein
MSEASGLWWSVSAEVALSGSFCFETLGVTSIVSARNLSPEQGDAAWRQPEVRSAGGKIPAANF